MENSINVKVDDFLKKDVIEEWMTGCSMDDRIKEWMTGLKKG